MEFKELNVRLRKHVFKEMMDGDYLFEMDVDGDRLWDLYLDAFPEGTNEIFRERREYDCSCCRSFVRKMGNVVAIKEGKLISIWDVNVNNDKKFQPVFDDLSITVKNSLIKDVHFSKQSKIGTEMSREKLDSGEILNWYHFYLELPDKFVNTSGDSISTLQNDYRTTKNVFKRSLEEITVDAIQTVLELISQNSLYRGDKWENTLDKLLEYKEEYMLLDNDKEKNIFTWYNSVNESRVLGKIRNHSIGTLLTNISEGMPLDTAVNKYESIVAPENYQRPKPVYTKKMLEKAKNRVEELGLMDTLYRRHAKLSDISVNDILFVNRDSKSKLSDGDIFDEMSKEVKVDPKNLSRVQEVTVDKFIKDILPDADRLEILLENRLEPNLVSLIAPEKDTDGQLFKWSNLFSWAYKGNLADSSMRDRVKLAGGNVDGVLRFSIQWNDVEYNPNDFDAHCLEPGGSHIYFGRMKSHVTKAELDVDIINPVKGTPAIENIAWPSKSEMEPGSYNLFVKNYSHNGGRGGFTAEVEFDGEIYSFEYNNELRQKEEVPVATVKLDESGNFEIVELLDSTKSSKEIWNLETNQFHPVTVTMMSPNYWEDSDKVGNKHYFFMVDKCKNSEEPNPFYNEFLRDGLREERKVLEALGSKLSVDEVDDQLSGLGFSSTQDNHVIVKIVGNIDRVLKIKF